MEKGMRNRGVFVLSFIAVVSFGLFLGESSVWAHEEEEGELVEGVGHQAQVLHLAGTHEVTMGAGLTIVGQGLSGTEDDQGGVTYSADLAFEGDFEEKGMAFIYINSAQGTGVDTGAETGSNADKETGSLADDAGYSDTRIAEAWYQLPIGEILSLTLGKIDPTGIYDGNEVANDETTQFLADAFVNNPAIAFPGYTGGASLTAALMDSVSVSLGLFEPGDDFVGTFEYPFSIGEIDIATQFAGLDGNWRLIAWSNAADDNSGFALSADHKVVDAVTLFGRYGIQDDEQDFDNVVSIGGQLEMGDHMFGLGYSQVTPTDEGKDNESQVEAYWSMAISENVHTTADIQWVSNPGFNGSADSVTVYGLRMQIDL